MKIDSRFDNNLTKLKLGNPRELIRKKFRTSNATRSNKI